MLNTPVLVRSLKLSSVEPSQYLDGWPPGNTGCCWRHIFFTLSINVSMHLNLNNRWHCCLPKLFCTLKVHGIGGSCKFWQLLSINMTRVLTAWPILAKMCGVVQIRATIAHYSSKALNQRGLGGSLSHTLHKHTYLDKGFTMINEVVPPGRGWSIALRIWLTPAISTNVGNSVSQFLLVGNCVRAIPYSVFFPIEPAGSSFFGGFKIRVILEWGLY